MARYHSKFSNKKHSVGGVMATLMGVASIALFVIAVMESFSARGDGGTIVGSLAMLSLAFSVFGLITGLLSYREVDRYTTFSLSGSLICGIMTVLLIMLILVGL